MRLISFLPLLLVAAVPAQSIEIYPGVTQFTSRGDLGPSGGELAQGFHRSHWRAIGSTGAFSRLVGLRYVVQDQNAATQSFYDVVVRQGADSTGPAAGSGGVLCFVGRLSLPAGSGQMAWIVTTALAQPCLIPTDGFFSVGLRVPPEPGWSGDGVSVHSAPAAYDSGPQRQDHAWQFVDNTQAFTHPSRELSWRFALLTDTPVVQNGVFPTGTRAFSRGLGGMFPPLGTHGWSTHVDGGPVFARGIARVFLTASLLPQPIVAPFVRGSIYLGPDAIGLATLFLDGDGRGDLPIVDPVRRFGITPWVQAVMIDNSLTRFATTNAQAATFQ